MCDVNDEIPIENPVDGANLIKSTCMKCKTENAVVVVRVHDPLCETCFLTYVTHKFRSTLGKARLVKADDNVLLAMSGGHSSMAMFKLVTEALSEKAHKRLRFAPAVLYIDESCLIGEDDKYASSVISGLELLTKEYDTPFYHFPIYKGFVSSDDIGEKSSLLRLHNKIKTLTAKSDFLYTLRMKVISNFARENNFQKIMIGENATRLSIKLLSHVAQGRGATISEDIGIGDYRYDGVVVIRPMREFSPKEVAVYNRMKKMNVLNLQNLDTKALPNSSIQRQTEEFILGLQDGFPSTVNTVFRTGDKICSSAKKSLRSCQCILCNSQIENNIEGLADLTKQLSTNDLLVLQVKNQLCYACRLTFKDFGENSSLLPSDIIEKVKHMNMKEQISDYLLE